MKIKEDNKEAVYTHKSFQKFEVNVFVSYVWKVFHNNSTDVVVDV